MSPDKQSRKSENKPLESEGRFGYPFVKRTSPFASIRSQFLEIFNEFRHPPTKADITASPDPSALDLLIEKRFVIVSIVSQIASIVEDIWHPVAIERTAKPIKVKPLWAIRRLHKPAAVLSLVLLAVFFAANPDFLRSQPRRVIRIAGQDYDKERFVVRELLLPPELSQPKLETPPKTAESLAPPVVPLPVPEEAIPTPPLTSPEPPPTPSPPEKLPLPEPPPEIRPDDVIAEGARPDADPTASKGNTLDPSALADRAESSLTTSDLGQPGEPGDGGEGGDLAEESKSDEESALLAENTNPNALILPDFRKRAESIIDEQLERSRQNSMSGRQAGTNQGLQELPNFSTEEPTILSDTRGYDFGPYMNQVINRVRVNWYSLIPEAARLGRRGRVVIIFTIRSSGGVEDMRIVANSGADPLDRSAAASIQASNPFPPLPNDFDSDHIVLQFTFMYNME